MARHDCSRPHRLAAAIGAALTTLAALPALADSGNGADTSIANALNPSGSGLGRPRDADGIGGDKPARTPTGLLGFAPYALREGTPTAAGWSWRGSVEAGALGLSGDRNAAKFGEYKSLDSGLYLNLAELEAANAKSGQYLTLSLGAPGENDAFFSLIAGRPNSWKLRLFYNETDHLFTTTYRNLWSGTGSGRLSLNNLPAGPVAPATAASTDIAIGAAALATPYSSLSVQRQKAGLRLDLTLSERWKLFASIGSERRQGARPFGLVSAGAGGTGGVEIPESIDYDTHEALAGLAWSSARTSLNLQASVSQFRNNVSTMSVDNPMFLAAANGLTRFPQAVYDLPPDNELSNVKLEFAHAMPELHRARFTAVWSESRSRQNDALIPQTPYSGAVVNGVAGGAWDSVNSLSRATAGAAIDTRLVDLGFALSPAKDLDVKAKIRRYETSNGTDYLACNPLTGQWGRLINDGSGGAFAVPNATAGNNSAGTPATAYNAAACSLAAVKALGLVPSAGNANIRSVPYDYTQTHTSAGADWRFARSQSLALAFERESFDRSHRERAETWEDRVRLAWVNRAMAAGTLRASLELGRRRGSTYVSDPYDEFASASFGPLPTAAGTNVTSWIHINDLHRKFDLADRDHTVLNLRFNTALRDDLDLAVSAQFNEQRYPGSAYGRSGRQRQNSANVDLNWQAAHDLALYGYLSAQETRMAQVGLQQNACVLGTTYYFYSDGSVATTATPSAAQVAAGITVVGTSGAVTAANFASLCGSASPTSPLYPTSRRWTAEQSDHSTALGIGARRDFGSWSIDANLGHLRSRSQLSYSYNAAALGLVTSGAPTAAQLAALALIGSGMPTMLFQQTTLDVNVRIPFNKTTALRLLLRHEDGRIRDWHYDGVAANPTPSTNQQTYLDAGPGNWRTTMVGALLQVSW